MKEYCNNMESVVASTFNCFFETYPFLEFITNLQYKEYGFVRLLIIALGSQIKFVVDGDWRIDPSMESVTRDTLHNNILKVDR